MATILHADMDAFYASVEQRDHPELRGKPVIVGGTGARGVVAAASYEARPFGVRSAMPTATARRLCPEGVFLPGRMGRYAEVSRTLRRIFGEFTPEVEPLSLDEAFLDVTGSVRLFGSPVALARRLKGQVRSETGLAVSVGIAPVKMVAKIASDLSKPDGLLEVPPEPETVRRFLAPLPVRRLWGVGPKAEQRLHRIGIRTIGELAEASVSGLTSALGRLGPVLQELAAGIDPRKVDSSGRRRSYGEENTFSEDLHDGDWLRRTIVAHAESVGRRLRADGARARTITLKVKTARRLAPGRYPLLTRSRTLLDATDDGGVIAGVALELWLELGDQGPVRLVGVTASGLDDEAGDQLPLFDSGRGRRVALNRALDRIEAQFGPGAISSGGASVVRASPTGRVKDPLGYKPRGR